MLSGDRCEPERSRTIGRNVPGCEPVVALTARRFYATAKAFCLLMRLSFSTRLFWQRNGNDPRHEAVGQLPSIAIPRPYLHYKILTGDTLPVDRRFPLTQKFYQHDLRVFLG